MENYFKGFIVEHIERSKNVKSNELVKVAARKITLPLDVFFKTIKDSSIKTIESEPGMVNIIVGDNWREPIMT
jgi:hypothetical protein